MTEDELNAAEAVQIRNRAKRIVEEQPRHSDVSLREQLWREFEDASDEVIERAVQYALYERFP